MNDAKRWSILASQFNYRTIRELMDNERLRRDYCERATDGERKALLVAYPELRDARKGSE